MGTDSRPGPLPGIDNAKKPVGWDMMQPHEFRELRNQISEIASKDPQLGRALNHIALHLGHSHGFDPEVEDAKDRAKALNEARRQEDDKVKEDAELLKRQRAHEDAMMTTPEQRKDASFRRADEDSVLDEQAKERSERRAQEDKETK